MFSIQRYVEVDSSAKDGQCDEFVSLFARHERAVRAFVRSLLPSWHDVDDVMQEVGLTCWRKFDSFNPGESHDQFIRWACGIARNEIRMYRRRRARDRLVFCEDVIELLADDAQQRLQRGEAERQLIEYCLEQLGEQERMLLLSLHTPGESIAKIAASLGLKARRLYSKVNALRDLVSSCVRKHLPQEA